VARPGARTRRALANGGREDYARLLLQRDGPGDERRRSRSCRFRSPTTTSWGSEASLPLQPEAPERTALAVEEHLARPARRSPGGRVSDAREG
jgi:hypothetical protein